MIRGVRVVLGVAALACGAAGCATSGSSAGSGQVYAGTGFHDPWDWGPMYREPPIVLGPPARPVHPIAPPARGTPR